MVAVQMLYSEAEPKAENRPTPAARELLHSRTNDVGMT